MTMFFSVKTHGFYHSDIHSSMPDDVIELTNAEYAKMKANQEQGKDIHTGISKLKGKEVRPLFYATRKTDSTIAKSNA